MLPCVLLATIATSLKAVTSVRSSPADALSSSRSAADRFVRDAPVLREPQCRLLGTDLNFLPVPEEANDSMSADEKRGNQRGKEFFQFGAAYAAMQGTTPYTLGAVLALSPLSTIAYLCVTLRSAHFSLC